jgi:hypothetical protein
VNWWECPLKRENPKEPGVAAIGQCNALHLDPAGQIRPQSPQVLLPDVVSLHCPSERHMNRPEGLTGIFLTVLYNDIRNIFPFHVYTN